MLLFALGWQQCSHAVELFILLKLLCALQIVHRTWCSHHFPYSSLMGLTFYFAKGYFQFFAKNSIWAFDVIAEMCLWSDMGELYFPNSLCEDVLRQGSHFWMDRCCFSGDGGWAPHTPPPTSKKKTEFDSLIREQYSTTCQRIKSHLTLAKIQVSGLTLQLCGEKRPCLWRDLSNYQMAWMSLKLLGNSQNCEMTLIICSGLWLYIRGSFCGMKPSNLWKGDGCIKSAIAPGLSEVTFAERSCFCRELSGRRFSMK